MAIYDFQNKSPREIAQMVQGIIGENLAQRDPAFARAAAMGQQIAARDPTRARRGGGSGGDGATAFTASRDPVAGAGPGPVDIFAAPNPVSGNPPSGCCAPCAVKTSQATVSLPGGGNSVLLIGARSNRVGIIFYNPTNAASVINIEPMLASSQFGMFIFTTRGNQVFLAKDYGNLVGSAWHGLDASGGTHPICVTEIFPS